MTPRLSLACLAALLIGAAPSRASDVTGPKTDTPAAGPSIAAPSGQAQLNTLNVQGGGAQIDVAVPPAGAADADIPGAAASGPGAAAAAERSARQAAEGLPARGALDPGVTQGRMAPRAVAREAAGLRQAVSPAARASGGVEGALNSRYDNTSASLGASDGEAGMGAVAGLAPTLAKQVRHEVEQGNEEASRHGAQAAASARAALAFYQTAVNLVAERFKARQVDERQYKDAAGAVVEQARAHAVSRQLPDETGAKREVGALQSLAAGVVPGDKTSVESFAASAAAWSKFIGLPIANLEDVKAALSARSANGVAPAIRFYRRDEGAIAADLSGVSVPGAAAASRLVVVPSSLLAEMKLGGAAAAAPPAFEAPEMPAGFLARLASNARLRERAGSPAPAAWLRAAWSSARAAVRAAWDAAAGLAARVYGVLRPARVDVAGGAPLVSSDRAVLRLAALRPRAAEGLDSADARVVLLDLSALSAARPDLDAVARFHEQVTGEGSARWFAANARGAQERADWRLKIADKALSRIDRDLLEAAGTRAVAYADLDAGLARLLVRDAAPGEAAALQGLGFEAEPAGGVWVGASARADRAQLEDALRLLGGKPRPALEPAALERLLSSAEKDPKAREAARRADARGRRDVGVLEVRGVRWLVQRAGGLLLFSNPDTRRARFAVPQP